LQREEKRKEEETGRTRRFYARRIPRSFYELLSSSSRHGDYEAILGKTKVEYCVILCLGQATGSFFATEMRQVTLVCRKGIAHQDIGQKVGELVKYSDCF
jgi:hypothetical protein